MARTSELAKKKVKRATQKLSPKEAEKVLVELGTEKAVQAKAEPEGRVPGKVRAGNVKTAFTLADFDAYGKVIITPDHTMKITLQGVKRQLIEGVQMELPKHFANFYENWKKNQRTQNRRVADDIPVRGYVSDIHPGAGSFVE